MHVKKKKASARAPFGYFGSKNKIAAKLLKNLPPHNVWVEAFCGSAALTFAKSPAPSEVINDIDDQIINLFNVLRSRPEVLCRNIALTPYARKELTQTRKRKKPRNKIEQARSFLIQSMMAMNGVSGKERGGFSTSLSYSRNNREARVNRWYNLPERLANVVERLRSVRVEHRDARLLLNDYIDKPATLVYLDPPYFADRTNGYNHDAKDEKFHTELLQIANKARCMVFISGYDNKLYRKLLSRSNGWSTKRIQTVTRDTDGHEHERTEVIWMNKHFVNAQKTRRVPIRLTPSEKKNNKINPSRS